MNDARLVAKVQVTYDVYIDHNQEFVTTNAWEPGYDYIAVRDYTVNDVWIDPETANEAAELYEADGADDIDPDCLAVDSIHDGLRDNLPEGEQTKRFREYFEEYEQLRLSELT